MSSAPAAWAKTGGASPVVPKSMLPAASASRSCGPPGNSVHLTVTPSGARRFSSSPRTWSTMRVPYFCTPIWIVRSSPKAGADAKAGATASAAAMTRRRRRPKTVAVRPALVSMKISLLLGLRHARGWRDIGDDLAEGPGIAGGPEVVARGRAQRQQREDELGEAVAFLEMGISRQDESVDAQRHIFLHACGDLLRIADQSRARPAAHQADTGPEIGADLELVAPPAMEARHALLADGIESREGTLRRGDGLVVEMLD